MCLYGGDIRKIINKSTEFEIWNIYIYIIISIKNKITAWNEFIWNGPLQWTEELQTSKISQVQTLIKKQNVLFTTLMNSCNE